METIAHDQIHQVLQEHQILVVAQEMYDKEQEAVVVIQSKDKEEREPVLQALAAVLVTKHEQELAKQAVELKQHAQDPIEDLLFKFHFALLQILPIQALVL